MARAQDPINRTAEEIDQLAAEWLIRVDHERTPESSKALADWLDEHPRHRASFLRVSTAWRRADVLRRLADPVEAADPDLLAPESAGLN